MPGDEHRAREEGCNARAHLHKNVRWPSYGGWKDFAVEVGLDELFFDEEHGLMRPHPGCAVLREHHESAIALALAAYRVRYPHAVAGFDGSDEDGALARLEWLWWWVRWALDNCERPAIYNS